jgi:hypothetical protein
MNVTFEEKHFVIRLEQNTNNFVCAPTHELTTHQLTAELQLLIAMFTCSILEIREPSLGRGIQADKFADL